MSIAGTHGLQMLHGGTWQMPEIQRVRCGIEMWLWKCDFRMVNIKRILKDSKTAYHQHLMMACWIGSLRKNPQEQCVVSLGFDWNWGGHCRKNNIRHPFLYPVVLVKHSGIYCILYTVYMVSWLNPYCLLVKVPRFLSHDIHLPWCRSSAAMGRLFLWRTGRDRMAVEDCDGRFCSEAHSKNISAGRCLQRLEENS